MTKSILEQDVSQTLFQMKYTAINRTLIDLGILKMVVF